MAASNWDNIELDPMNFNLRYEIFKLFYYLDYLLFHFMVVLLSFTFVRHLFYQLMMGMG